MVACKWQLDDQFLGQKRTSIKICCFIYKFENNNDNLNVQVYNMKHLYGMQQGEAARLLPMLANNIYR